MHIIYMPLLFPDGCSFVSNGVGCTKRADDVPWTRNPRIPSGIKKSSEEKNMEKKEKIDQPLLILNYP